MASRPVVVEVPDRVLLAEKADELSFAKELQALARRAALAAGLTTWGREG